MSYLRIRTSDRFKTVEIYLFKRLSLTNFRYPKFWRKKIIRVQWSTRIMPLFWFPFPRSRVLFRYFIKKNFLFVTLSFSESSFSFETNVLTIISKEWIVLTAPLGPQYTNLHPWLVPESMPEHEWTTVHVSNVPLDTPRPQLEAVFSSVGPVKKCFVVKGNVSTMG